VELLKVETRPPEARRSRHRYCYLAAQLPVAVERLEMSRLFDMSRVPELAQSPALQARCLVALGAALRSAKVPA
jgi:hypothetical protein